MSQNEILERISAAIKGITTTTTAGDTLLEPEQFDRYVRQLQVATAWLPLARRQIMRAPLQDIDRIAFSDVLLGPPAGEGVAISTGDYYNPAFAQHQLTAVELQGVLGITDKLLRSNPERDALMNTIMQMMAERTGLDIEDQGINGDTAITGTTKREELLKLNDGWLKKTRRYVTDTANDDYDDGSTTYFSTGVGETTATVYWDMLPISGGTWQLWEDDTTTGTQVADEDGDGIVDPVAASGVGGTIDYNSGKVDLTGLTASTNYVAKYTADGYDPAASAFPFYPENMFDRMIQVVPQAYFRRPGEWYICVSKAVFYAYRALLRNRGTDLGDMYQANGNAEIVPFQNVNVLLVPNMPDNRAWLTHPDNTLYGVFHEVQIEEQREAVAKRTDIIVNVETDYEFEEPEATVIAHIY